MLETAARRRTPRKPKAPDGFRHRHVPGPGRLRSSLRGRARGVPGELRARRRRRRFGRHHPRWRAGGRPLGRCEGRGPTARVDGRHDRRGRLDHQDRDGALGPAAGRPRRARRRCAGRALLAGVRPGRQGGRLGAPLPGPHRWPARLGRPAGHGRPLRLGEVHRPARRPGALVGAGNGVGLPRGDAGLPCRRGDPPHHRPQRRDLLPRRDRRAARRGVPHRREARVRRADRRIDPARRPGGAGPDGAGQHHHAHPQQPAAAARALGRGRLAARGDPGRQRFRQRPRRRPDLDAAGLRRRSRTASG